MILTKEQLDDRKARWQLDESYDDYIDTIEAAWSELRSWQDGVGRGCLIVSERHLEKNNARIAALEAVRDTLKRQLAEAQEEIDALKLGYRGFP